MDGSNEEADGTGAGDIRSAILEIRDRLRRQDALADAGQVRLLRTELIAMAASIEQARREIASLRPPERRGDEITTAAGELEAILGTTQDAAEQILSSAEALMALSAELKMAGVAHGLAARIEEQTGVLLTACSFQDLTGQRAAKVLRALRFIEERVAAMAGIWDLAGVEPVARPTADGREDSHLLNGPGAGADQASIDALFD